MTLTDINPRRAVAVAAGRAAAVGTRLLRRGGGTALPGLVASRVDPTVVRSLAAQLTAGSVVVSGTNGKTTTSQMIAAILKEAGIEPIRNRSGSNLMRGIASTLIGSANLWGNLDGTGDLGLFEVDEAAFPEVVRSVRPRTILLLNLFRDQLDRYGEVATIGRLWKEALSGVGPGTTIVANADDPLIVDVAQAAPVPVTYFGIESAATEHGVVEHASDVKACPRCGGPMTFSVVFLAHQGHYACTRCDLRRPTPAVRAHDVALDGIDGSSFRLNNSAVIRVNLPGLYNAYNALAAAALTSALGVNEGDIAMGLSRVRPAFGRMEALSVEGRTVQLALAKNPAGLNEVVRTLSGHTAPLHLLVMLNDNTADGHDVSWIWDADVEPFAGHIASVCFSGTRAADMALRFKYGGLLSGDNPPTWEVVFDPAAALRKALEWTPAAERLFIIPTYTAMLQIRAVLDRLGHTRPYWEEDPA